MNLDWHDFAACRGRDDLFFGPEEETGRQRNLRVKAAAAVCVACPVWRECRAYSTATNQKFGVWGGRDVEQAGGVMCRNGLHLMTIGNTWTGPSGVTRCRECRNAADRRARTRRQEKRAA